MSLDMDAEKCIHVDIIFPYNFQSGWNCMSYNILLGSHSPSLKEKLSFFFVC